MSLEYQQLIELLAKHFQASDAARDVDWSSAAWQAWRRRMEELDPAGRYTRLTAETEIEGAIQDLDVLLDIAGEQESQGGFTEAKEIFEFVRSTAARQLGPQHRVTEDATCGLIRACRSEGNDGAAEQIEQHLYVDATSELADATDDGLISLAYSAIDGAGFGVGLASAGPAERLRRFIADELWPRLEATLDEFDTQAAQQWAAIQSSVGEPLPEKVSYAAAVALVLKRGFSQLAPGLDTSTWRSRDWAAMALTLLRFRDSRPA